MDSRFIVLLLLVSAVTTQQPPKPKHPGFRPKNGTDGAPLYWKSNNAHMLRHPFNLTAQPEVTWTHPRRSRRSALSAEEQQEAVDQHNYFRSREQASDMLYMYSDDVLINRAQAWAEGCVYKHQTTSGAGTDYSAVGENLYMSTASHTTNWAIKNWVDGEIWYYDYDSKTCQDGEQCGHYTQCVWAETQYVGCGQATCSPLYGSDGTSVMVETGYYTVCNYGDMGNFVGQYPFQRGDVCTECSTGQFECFDQLCRDCTTDGCLEYEYECYAACENCGTVSDTCTCDCPAEFNGIHCQNLRGGQTDPGNDCPVATPEPPAPPCGGIYCFNGATKLELSETECFCSCPLGWQGDFCEFNQEQQENGVLLTVMGDSSKYSDLWFYLEGVLVDSVNTLCQDSDYFDLCCNSQASYAGPYTNEFVTGDGYVATGDGYPNDLEGGLMEFLVYAKPSPSNDLCGAGDGYYIPQSVMIEAITQNKARVTAQLLGCCLFFLVQNDDWLLQPEVVTNPYLDENGYGGIGTPPSNGNGDNGDGGVDGENGTSVPTSNLALAVAMISASIFVNSHQRII